MPRDIIGAPAKTDITGTVQRFEGDTVEQFTLTNTLTVPATVQFIVYNTDGNSLAPVAAQSGQTVTVSAAGADIGSVGVYYLWRQLPVSAGFYNYEWRMFGSGGASSGTIAASVFTVRRGEFDVFRTEAHSFFTYGNRGEVVRRARQLVSRGDLTERDIRPHMEAADGWIDSKLGIIVSVPISPAPMIVRELSNHGAIYFLFTSYYGGQRAEIPADIQRQWEQDNTLLDGIVEGKYSLAGSGVTFRKEDEVTHIEGGIEGGVPVFGRSDFAEQEIDADITDAESDQRD